MNPPVKLVKLSVVQNATQKNVSGVKNWAAVRKNSAYVIIEATTAPKNNIDEWKQIQWLKETVDMVHGHPIKETIDIVHGHPNRRKISLAASKKYHVEAKLGGVNDYVDVWVLWASIEILTKGSRPTKAAPFDPGMRDNTNNLGAVTYKTITSSVIDEKAGLFVDNMGASGKVAPVATLTPKGVNQIVKAGWTFEREVWSHNWSDGIELPSTNKSWTRDTSKPTYLRLTPDVDDKIYDLDGPDIRWGQFNSETYNNFRQWITWNTQKCSDYALWYWQARWSLNKDLSKQITLNELGKGNINLPSRPHFPARKAP